MNFSHKLTCLLVLVLALALGLGGCVLIYGDFADRLAEAQTANARTHDAACRDVETRLIEASRSGESTGELEILTASTASHTGLAGMELTPWRQGSAFVDGCELQDGDCVITREGSAVTARYYSLLWGGYGLLTSYDLTPLYTARTRSLARFLLLEGVVLVCGAVCLWLLARHITRPLSVLRDASGRIAAGDYAGRTALHTGDEVEQVSASFDAMADAVQDKIAQLEASVRQREDFMAAFTHELKTPMTSIIGYADMLRTMQADPADQREAAGAIYHEGRRLESLSRKLLQLLELSDVPLIFTEVPLRQVFSRLQTACRTTPLILPDTDAAVQGDEDLILDLLYNLVSNAAKSGTETPVRVTCAEHADTVAVTVADEGRGIPPEALSRVMEPFYMVDKSRARRQGGSGLGLALCRRIAEAHGGTLEIESKPGAGTRVTVTLPKGGEPHDP